MKNDDESRGARLSDEEVSESLAALDRAVAAMRASSARSVMASEEFARDARNARPSRKMQAVRAEKSSHGLVPITEDAAGPSDLTSRFRVIKRGL